MTSQFASAGAAISACWGLTPTSWLQAVAVIFGVLGYMILLVKLAATREKDPITELLNKEKRNPNETSN